MMKAENMQKPASILKDAHSTLIVYSALSSLLFLSRCAVIKTLQAFGMWHLGDEKQTVIRVIEREANLADKRRGLRLAPA
jgi:hypothetical protein